MVVKAPVVDLRHRPESRKKLSLKKNDWHQTSQLLCGDKVYAFDKDKTGKWLRIGAVDQKIFSKGKWPWLHGWIRADQVVSVDRFPKYNLVVKEPWARIRVSRFNNKWVLMGTPLKGVRKDKDRWDVTIPGEDGSKDVTGYIFNDFVHELSKLKELDEPSLRFSIVQTAQKFKGSPYLWGGMSFYKRRLRKCDKQLTGVDCSGLAHLCYKVNGICIPRNSVSQYKSEKCKKLLSNPKPGDLVFLANGKDPSKISHVIIYMGSDRLVEARGSDVREVVEVTGKERFGKPVYELKKEDKTKDGHFIYFGSYVS